MLVFLLGGAAVAAEPSAFGVTAAAVRDGVEVRRNGEISWDVPIRASLNLSFEPSTRGVDEATVVSGLARVTLDASTYHRVGWRLIADLRLTVEVRGPHPADWSLSGRTAGDLPLQAVPYALGAIAWEEGEDPDWPPTLSVSVGGTVARPEVVVWRTPGAGLPAAPWLRWTPREP